MPFSQAPPVDTMAMKIRTFDAPIDVKRVQDKASYEGSNLVPRYRQENW